MRQTTAEKTWPAEMAYVAARNATMEQLKQAEEAKGKLAHPFQTRGEQGPAYRLSRVRLDALNRLLFDFVRADLYQPGVDNLWKTE